MGIEGTIVQDINNKQLTWYVVCTIDATGKTTKASTGVATDGQKKEGKTKIGMAANGTQSYERKKSVTRGCRRPKEVEGRRRTTLDVLSRLYRERLL